MKRLVLANLDKPHRCCLCWSAGAVEERRTRFDRWVGRYRCEDCGTVWFRWFRHRRLYPHLGDTDV